MVRILAFERHRFLRLLGEGLPLGLASHTLCIVCDLLIATVDLLPGMLVEVVRERVYEALIVIFVARRSIDFLVRPAPDIMPSHIRDPSTVHETLKPGLGKTVINLDEGIVAGLDRAANPEGADRGPVAADAEKAVAGR